MTKLVKKLICAFLALLMILSAMSVALAEETALRIDFSGVFATKDGNDATVPLEGVFEVFREDERLFALHVTPDGENTMDVPGAGQIRLVPVMDTIPAGIVLSEYGYSLTLTAGRLNIAPLTVRANAGLFVLEGDADTEYALLDAEGEYALTFCTDENGRFELDVAIAAGVYTLTMAEPAEGWVDQEIEIQTYAGEETVLMIHAVTLASAEPEATVIPEASAEPTPGSTPVPTETPAPTQAPTPVSQEGTLVVTASGAQADLAYQITADEAAIAQGTLNADSPIRLDGLQQGEYLVTLTLPEDVALVRLNSIDTAQFGTASWRVAVTAMAESVYTVELAQTANVAVSFVNVQPIAASANASPLHMNEDGTGTADHLLPGDCIIEVTLPAGRYAFDDAQWTMTDQGNGTYLAKAALTLEGGEVAELSAVTRLTEGGVRGLVNGTNDKPLSGVIVTVSDASGAAVENLTTDANGAWQITALPYGTYSVQYDSEGVAIPGTSFTLDDANIQAELTADAEKPAKITVRAFLDENNNGNSKGDSFVKDVEIELLAADGTAVTSAVTNKNGYATLYAGAGTYTVRATVPANYGFGKTGDGNGYTNSIMAETADRTQVSAPVTLSLNDPLEVGIGLQAMARVTGTVWNDVNADGIWQANEPGIPGVRVTIEGKKVGVFREVYTDENGFYELGQLKKGTYELTCYVPDEYVFTVKAKGDVAQISRMTTEADRAGTDQITLDRGEVYTDHNIGMMDGVIIEGVCFLDENYNGYYDEGERTLAGVEMRLARQSNNVLLQQTVSDENGVYHFYGQRGSTFTIRANLPSGYVFSVVGTGENGNRFAPDGYNTERRLKDVTLENGSYMQAMLGAVTFGTISGKVYFDENFSTAYESGEKAGSGYLVTLLDANGGKVASKKTDRNGNYTFEKLNPGQYILTMTPEKGYAFTAVGAGNVLKTQDDGTGRSNALQLTMGEDMSANIGMIKPAKVSGVVFADENDNGLQDQGEKGLTGTVVRLMGESGEADSITVGANGQFSFNAVLPGKYYLRYELPESGVFSPVAAGGNAVTGEERTADTTWFSVEVGSAYAAPVCGASLLSTISGVTFADTNGNGELDADEAFLAGLRISMTPENPAQQAYTVVTGEDGAFAIEGIRPGVYTLTVECPDACVLSRMPKADLGLTHGLNAQSIRLTVEMGSRLTQQQLGCVLPSKWTGYAYLDENYDGIRAANEPPAVGETILLLDANSGETVASVLTDENGAFLIEGIAPGEYELAYELGEGNLVPKAGDNHLHLSGKMMTTGRVRVNENENMTDTLVAIVRTTNIGGRVWLEKHDGVTSVAGAKVLLLDGDGKQVAECVTGEDGLYAFDGLMPGEYTLDATIPAGYTLVEDGDAHLAVAGLFTVISEANGVHGVSTAFYLHMADHQLALDIGCVLPGRLGDKVWLDLNGNGLQDGDEGGIPGVTIDLMRGDRVLMTAVSDQYGYYCFEDLYPTEYVLRVIWPDEIKPTILRTEIPQISSVLQEDGLSIPVTVESNKANYAADLGFALVEEGKYPAGYGEGKTQTWKK